MKVIAPIVATLASSSEIFDDGSPSLLQLRKATHSEEGHHHKQQVFFNSSHEQFSGHSFGCTGRQTAQNVIRCVNGGDVHEHRWYGGDPRSDWNGLGWYWMAKSIDGSFGAQAFVRQGDNGAGWATMSHFAFKFGDTVVFIDRDSAPDWEFKYYWNGVEKSRTDCPIDVAGVYWSNRGQTDPDWAVATGATNAPQAGFWGAAERHSCWEYQQVALWTGYQDWQDANLGPYAKMGTLEIEGETTYLDENYGQCARDTRRVSNDEMLVTPAQNDKVCSDNGLTADQCGDPNPQIPLVPPASHLCEFNGVSIDHANLLCAGQEVHGQDVFDDCVYDVCATIDADEQQAAAGGAAMEAAMMNPRVVCALHPDNCRSCNICNEAQQVDLSNPVQNNLGGAGPDSGAEELRYANAMTVNGRSVDVVLVAQTAYVTPKPQRNGFKQGGFGRFTIRAGTTSDMQFLFQDSETRAPVSVENIALTFYDLDEAIEFRNREGRQRETITACQAEEIYLTEDTELQRSDLGVCTSFTSTTIGNGQDNPRSQGELTMTQAARSVTYEFHARASISWTASVTGNRRNPRPILFSFAPQVACGASDSETPCSPPAAPTPPPPDCRLSAYWDFGNCGCGGDDQNWNWCGNQAGRCPDTVNPTVCPSGTAYLVEFHPKPYCDEGHRAEGTEGHLVREGCEYIYHAQYSCEQPEWDCQLSAYWEFGSNGGCGDDHHAAAWCGGIYEANCPPTVLTDRCPSGTAYLAIWHPKPYEDQGPHQGHEGHYRRNGVEYIWFAQYACQE